MQHAAPRTLKAACYCITPFRSGKRSKPVAANCLYDCTCTTLLIRFMIFKAKIYLNYRHIKTQSVPRSKHYISVIQTCQLMLYREIIAVCSEIHTKQNVNYIWRPSSYCAVNTLRLGYTNQSVNAVWGNICCLFSDPHKTHNLDYI